MDHKEFLQEIEGSLGTRLDDLVPKHDALVERRATLAKFLKPGMKKEWHRAIEYHPPRYEKGRWDITLPGTQ